MRGNYLIPANSKKSLLYFGLFNSFDLMLFGSGILTTIILMMALPIEGITYSMIAIAPAVGTGFLVFPVPNYHNVLTVIIDAYVFFTTNQRFKWKGWCFNESDGKDKR